jgi:hypothetical protein
MKVEHQDREGAHVVDVVGEEVAGTAVKGINPPHQALEVVETPPLRLPLLMLLMLMLHLQPHPRWSSPPLPLLKVQHRPEADGIGAVNEVLLMVQRTEEEEDSAWDLIGNSVAA